MKQQVTKIKDLRAALRDMEPWVKTPQVLYNGRSGNLSLLPREILANWLLCAVGNAYDTSKNLTFSNDPVGGGDGIILDQNSGDMMITEHVFVPKHKKDEEAVTEELICAAVVNKQSKGGKAYAEGKHLVVFCDGIGEWFPNRVGREIEGKHDFASVWAIGLLKAEENIYSYWVTCLNKDHCPAVRIDIDFGTMNWTVTQIQ